MQINKAALRKQLMHRRATLPSLERQQAEQQIITALSHDPDWQQAKKIASYLAVNSEVNLTSLHDLIWHSQKQLFIPVIKHEILQFAAYFPDGPLQVNQYQITEPVGEDSVSIDTLDLILVPLVGFDKRGQRLGMGKGYYDKTLAPLMTLTKRPLLIGVAFACQQTDILPADKWDIPLDKIITENGMIRPCR